MNKDFNYQRYLASREWAVLKEQVRERSGNRCEHCFNATQQAVHHLTYERIGHEEMRDLMAVCNPCHEFLSGKSAINPLDDFGTVSERVVTWIARGGVPVYSHYIIPFHGTGPKRVVHEMCQGEGCIWCGYADDTWASQLWGLIIPGPEQG